VNIAPPSWSAALRPAAANRRLVRPAGAGNGVSSEYPGDVEPVRDSLLDYAVMVTAGSYPENRSYLLPETLGELTGQVAGMVQLPLRLDWTERVAFHRDDPAERNVMYERVIREATRPEDLRSYLNGAVLRETWRQLFLPARVRRIWEERFPALRLPAWRRIVQSDMDPFHERLTRVALRAAGQYGFALAGGYAIQAHGFLDRLSADVDLFAPSSVEADFTTAVDAVIQEFGRDGVR
jgi:hypothetical protein